MKTTLAAVLLVVLSATVVFAKDKGEWFPITVTEVNPVQIGEKSHKSSMFTGHKVTSIAIEGHTFSVKANGRRYVLSNPKEMVEPGQYEASYCDKNRALKVRADGRREIILKIETVVPEPQVAQQKDFQSVENMLAPKSSSIAPVTPRKCIETLTMRDGSQSCLHWTEER